MKKILAIGIALTLSLGMITGCAKEATTPSQSNGSSVGTASAITKDVKGEISIGIMQSDMGESVTAAAFVDSFNQEYPNVKVTLKPISGDYSASVLQKAAAGNLPDVFWNNDTILTMLAEKKIAANLTPLIEADKIDLSIYYESVIKLSRKNYKGDLYMVPRDYSKVIIAYNKKLFEQAYKSAGKATVYPSDDWTWEQFLETCSLLKKNLPADTLPVDFASTWNANFNTIIEGFGGKIFDENGVCKLDMKETKDAINEMKKIVTNGYDTEPQSQRFLSGKSAMMISLRVHTSKYIDAKLDFDIVSYPITPNKYIPAGTSGYSMFDRSKNKDLAWLLLKHIISEKGQVDASKTGNIVPVIKSLSNGIWKNYPEGKKINNDAYIKFPERDKAPDYLAGVAEFEKYEAINSKLTTLISSYLQNKKDLDTLVTSTISDIERLRKDK